MLLRSASTPILSSADIPHHYHSSPHPLDIPKHATLSSPTPPRVRRIHSDGNLSNLARPKKALDPIPSFSESEEDPGEESEDGRMPMLLAVGIGLDNGRELRPEEGGGGGGGEKGTNVPRMGGGDKADMEGFYRTLVEENPTNALVLRNYAQFIHKVKADPLKAEHYYSRAMLAEPNDGEILTQYARLIWELHHDQERTMSYFERATQASPEDSYVLAAYASFLWETER